MSPPNTSAAYSNPCTRCEATKRDARGACKACRARRARDARKKGATESGKRPRTTTPKPAPECRHTSGALEIATPAAVRTFRDVKIWPQGPTLIVLLPRGERISFVEGQWSAASDRCDACGRELTITPATIMRKAG